MKITGAFNWKNIYDGQNAVSPSRTDRPVIGITGNLRD